MYPWSDNGIQGDKIDTHHNTSSDTIGMNCLGGEQEEMAILEVGVDVATGIG
jgi:hypothetical protein